MNHVHPESSVQVLLPSARRSVLMFRLVVLCLVFVGVVAMGWLEGMVGSSSSERQPHVANAHRIEIAVLESAHYMRRIVMQEDWFERQVEIGRLRQQRADLERELVLLQDQERGGARAEMLNHLLRVHVAYGDVQDRFLALIERGDLNGAVRILGTQANDQARHYLDAIADYRDRERLLIERSRQDAADFKDTARTLLSAMMALSLIIGIVALTRSRLESAEDQDAQAGTGMVRFHAGATGHDALHPAAQKFQENLLAGR